MTRIAIGPDGQDLSSWLQSAVDDYADYKNEVDEDRAEERQFRASRTEALGALAAGARVKLLLGEHSARPDARDSLPWSVVGRHPEGTTAVFFSPRTAHASPEGHHRSLRPGPASDHGNERRPRRTREPGSAGSHDAGSAWLAGSLAPRRRSMGLRRVCRSRCRWRLVRFGRSWV